MNPLQISRRRFSKIFWNIVVNKTSDDYDRDFDDLLAMEEHQQPLRLRADYKTGSIDFSDIADLYALVKFFEPHTIAEVGTYIGVSTLTMHLATGGLADIHTCDMSNDIKDVFDRDAVTYYPRTRSYDMFKKIDELKLKVDFVYLDGRLGQEDIEPLSKIIHDKTVFAMDDFEGVEKGVTNALMLESPGRVLIYPSKPTRKTAVSLPLSLLQIVPQEMT